MSNFIAFRRSAAIATALMLTPLILAQSTGEPALGRSTACVLGEDEANGATVAPSTVVSIRAPHYLSEMRGQRWDKALVTLRLAQSDRKRKAGETERILEDATRLWNEEIGGVVRIVWTTDEDADVIVRFAPGSVLPRRALGRTDAQFHTVSRTLLHADVLLSEGMSEARMLQVATHEIGHALGVSGHSPHPDDLMYPVTHTPTRITERDRNTLYLNYQTPPAPYPPTAFK